MSKNDQDQAKIILRQKAEEKLKLKRSKVSPVLKADSKKLLHELQVHQIELEMQNDDLKKAYEANETALKKFTMLYDFAPMGYFTLNSDGTIFELNFTGADLIGESRFTLVNSNIMLFISKKSRKTFNDFFKRIYSSKDNESCVVLLEYDNNPLSHVYMKGVVTPHKNQVILSAIDITGLRKTNY